MLSRIARRWRWARLVVQGATIPYNIQTEAPFFRGYARGLRCGTGAYISAGARIAIGSGAGGTGNLEIGARLFLNHYACIDCHHGITIGDDVMIGPHAYICDFDHDMALHRAGHRAEFVGARVDVGNRVWIGAHAVVLKGVTIGDGAVIAAGAIVTSNVPAGVIVGGVPARVLRRRSATAAETERQESTS